MKHAKMQPAGATGVKTLLRFPAGLLNWSNTKTRLVAIHTISQPALSTFLQNIERRILVIIAARSLTNCYTSASNAKPLSSKIWYGEKIMVYQRVLKNAKYCPLCNGDTSVTDSRPNNNAIGLVRTRKCKACGHRFTTIEITTAEFYELINSKEK